jgi:hypothetical protein
LYDTLAATPLNTERKEVCLMNYETPEVLEIGRVQDEIHGSDKTEQNFLDSPVYRTSISIVEEVEE